MLHTAKTFTTLKSVKITFSKETGKKNIRKKTIRIWHSKSDAWVAKKQEKDKATTQNILMGQNKNLETDAFLIGI